MKNKFLIGILSVFFQCVDGFAMEDPDDGCTHGIEIEIVDPLVKGSDLEKFKKFLREEKYIYVNTQGGFDIKSKDESANVPDFLWFEDAPGSSEFATVGGLKKEKLIELSKKMHDFSKVAYSIFHKINDSINTTKIYDKYNLGDLLENNGEKFFVKFPINTKSGEKLEVKKYFPNDPFKLSLHITSMIPIEKFYDFLRIFSESESDFFTDDSKDFSRESIQEVKNISELNESEGDSESRKQSLKQAKSFLTLFYLIYHNVFFKKEQDAMDNGKNSYNGFKSLFVFLPKKSLTKIFSELSLEAKDIVKKNLSDLKNSDKETKKNFLYVPKAMYQPDISRKDLERPHRTHSVKVSHSRTGENLSEIWHVHNWKQDDWDPYEFRIMKWTLDGFIDCILEGREFTPFTPEYLLTSQVTNQEGKIFIEFRHTEPYDQQDRQTDQIVEQYLSNFR